MTTISHFKIGLFFLASVIIIAGGLFWHSNTRYFRETKTYVTYFDSSVQGLSSSSKVKYLGLEVGKISSLELVSPKGKNLVRVLVDLSADFKPKDTMAVRRTIKGITGQSYLTITQAPTNVKEITPEIDFELKYPLIPAIPGRIRQVEKALVDLYKKVEGLKVNNLVTEWEKLAQNANSLINKSRLNKSFSNIHMATQDLKDVFQRFETFTASLNKPGNSQSLNQTLNNIVATSKSARKISKSLEQEMDRLTPGFIAHLADNHNSTLGSLENSLQTSNSQITKSLRQFRQSLLQLNQVLAEIQNLARSLRTDPGRILNQTETREPFNK